MTAAAAVAPIPVKLTLTEAAQMLGKSPRQVRTMMKSGELKGQKIEGRWMFDRAALPVRAGREQAQQRKAAELGRAVEEALGPHLKPPGRKGYSVADLTAFRTGTREGCAAAALGVEHPAAVALRASLVALAQGCHRFHQRDKTAAFAEARERAAEALAHLYLDGTDAAKRIADAVEQEYLSAIVGLLRRQEGKDPR